MTVQPKYHWQFAEREGSIAKDTISGVEGNLNNAIFPKHDRMGSAISLGIPRSWVQFGNGVGQFGTSDFTIAFGMMILNNRPDQDSLDIIGNRSAGGQRHGNWVTLRLFKRERLRFEVDEDSDGKNHILAETDNILRKSRWYHIAVVREGATLRIYVDRVLKAETTADTGVANINNGVDFRLGHHGDGTPGALYEDLRIYHTALDEEQIQDLPRPRSSGLIPQFHWQFEERGEGSLAKDSVSGVEGNLNNAIFQNHGRIGYAIRVRGKEGHVNFGNVAGQFGTSDFTIAFGINPLNYHDLDDVDVIGNRSVKGHGNWVSLRTLNKGELRFEVDEDSNGKNYASARTGQVLTGKWQHIAIVRKGPALKIYVDGSLVAEGASKTGVANIQNRVDLKLGHWTRHAHTARYEDLRIYHTALTAGQIQALIPPQNRLLRPGQIELVDTSGAAVILTQDEDDLLQYSSDFQKLRIGPDTGATLYKGTDFEGVSQKLYTGVPDIKFTRLEAFPRSVHIWSSIGEPFTGNWIIAAPNGRYLSRRKHTLTTSPDHAADELFSFHYNPNLDQLMLIPVTDQEISLLRVDDQSSVLLVDDTEPDKDAFSIVHPSQDRWLRLSRGKRRRIRGPLGRVRFRRDDRFSWTQQREERAIFHRAAKIADNEGQVGELVAGEVALYESSAYKGRVWILSDSDNDRAGNYTRFTDFQGLNNRVSSIRLGPDTGVTVFDDENLTVSEANRETDVEDFVENVPHLSRTEVGNDAISSLTIFRTVAPETIFASFTSKLSQDYRMVDDKLEEFSAYRTTLRFAPNAGAIEVSATDLTTIEVEGTTHEIDELRSVTLSPNAMHRLMITSEADGLNTPGLKFRTSAMAENEFVVIFPDEEAHRQIAELEDDALWNATDAKGNLIVDRNAHTQSEVASVQSTIKRVMATTVPTDDPPAPDTDVFERSGLARSVSKGRVVASKQPQTSQVVSGTALGDPWTLHFAPRPSPIPGGSAGKSAGLVMASDRIWQEPVSQNDFALRLAQASGDGLLVSAPAAAARLGIFDDIRDIANDAADGITDIANDAADFANDIGDGITDIANDIGDAFKDATSVTIGFFEDAVNVLIEVGGKIVRFTLDTAKKVARFVEAVVEKVVESIKQFIEFLQFLFAWDDILDTQRYLVGAINAGFDYAAQLAQDAKPHVSAFFNNLQDTVEDNINTLVRTLGGEPSEVQTSDFELPEALEWFIDKLLGGSNQSDADTPSTSGETPSGDTPLEEFIRHFLEAIENIVGAGLRAFEGVSDSLLTLLKNPRKPQQALIVMIEAFRDVIIQLLEAGEDITLGLLSVIEGFIKLFQELLNREIRIPFISDLFELLGAGKLTILNLSTLLLAIPVTVVHKIAFNEAPFRGAAPLAFPTGPEARLAFSTGPEARLTAIASRRAADEEQDENEEDPPNRAAVLGLGTVSLVANLVNGFILNPCLDLTPEDLDDAQEKSEFFGMLEIASWVLDVYILLPTLPGFLKPVSSPMEGVLLGYRTAVLGLDLAVMTRGWASKGDDFNTQRMSRATKGTIIFTSAIGCLDMLLAAMFVAETFPEDAAEQSLNGAHQLLFALPRAAAPFRLITDPSAAVILPLINMATAVTTTVTGGILLANDAAASK